MGINVSQQVAFCISNMLYKNNLPIIDNGTLFALTLLIAESKPSEMEIMKQIVVSVLNKG